MFIRKAQPGDSARILPSEITSESAYLNRRQVIKSAIAAGLVGTAFSANAVQAPPRKLQFTHNKELSTDEAANSFQDITTYNNYYEFGTSKDDPATHSGDFKPAPWTIAVSGEAEVTGTFDLEDLIKAHPLEERVYRMRCVEAWSMVIPWVGMPLAGVLKSFKPTAKAKYVAFKTVYRPKEMPGQAWNALRWPYVEGLRIDEAMNPLALLAVGVYGQTLPNQNGAPVRLVTPWKYGFKGIKSIVEISFAEKQPATAWNIAAASEYGFYANVNPNVDHPRWSQARERRIGGSSIFAKQIPTRMFNGYEKEVADLYRGMDLKRYY